MRRREPARARTAIEALSFRIYCRVVDNYGDAGVCWRLARQLVLEHGARVALVIDAPQVLAAIVPGARAGQRCEGVAIERWPGSARAPAEGEVVISAFGCDLPKPVRAALAAPRGAGGARATRPPLWVNLEYLSAQSWVEGCHGLASRKPDDGAVEHFFYPGFTDATGGLLRERGLLRAGALAPGAPEASPARRVSLFCYPQAPAGELLEMIATGAHPTTVLIPVGVAERAIAQIAGTPPPPGTAVTVGRLRIERFALLPQPQYDRLLRGCDLNFVRGEDSWVRAIWAARPFVWQPYLQEGDAHLAKLEAFLARFEAVAGPGPGEVAPMMRAWNGGAGLETAWPAFAEALDRCAPAFARFRGALAAGTDLATRLVEFCRVRL